MRCEGDGPQVGSAASDALAPSPTFWVTSGHEYLAFMVHKPSVILIVLMNRGTLGISVYLKPIIDVLLQSVIGEI